jgi:hypothetical protein
MTLGMNKWVLYFLGIGYQYLLDISEKDTIYKTCIEVLTALECLPDPVVKYTMCFSIKSIPKAQRNISQCEKCETS